MKRRFLLWWMLCAVVSAHAGGPRWVAGSQWQHAGQAMTWYRNDVQYFVDAGPLSTYVSHAAAVSLIDAAAAPWNLTTLPLSLTYGGSLNEDVNAGTVYLGPGGMVWPFDASSANYTAKQIAIVLDADGSITDALLGAGASAPSSCRTNAVTETVDLFIQPGSIAHAVVVLNGRCTGPAAEQQLQLQYQLMRVFGRVLGLGWSQLNDNAFTGTPTATYAQLLHWPIMHPIDVVCGNYTYQCLPQPFTLRDDDISAMWQLYANAASSLSAANKVKVTGAVSFPNGAPMLGVNVVVRRYSRWTGYQLDAFQDVSSVSGFPLATNHGNPVTGLISDAFGTAGYNSPSPYAWFTMGAVDVTVGNTLVLTSEPVNPLYVGAYAVGPYQQGTPSPSGSAMNLSIGPFTAGAQPISFPTVTDAAFDCNTGADGKEDAPATMPAGGTWTGRLCSQGHTSWFSLPVKAGRNATFEVTATDESGGASSSKAMPLIGVWHAADAPGTLPTLAASGSALNVARTGMTQLPVTLNATETVRFAVTDARGEGRPDFTYRLRVLYADSITPSRLTSAGGTVVINGTGFSASCAVTVGGVAARILSQTATRLQVVAPAAAALNASGAQDVVVTDLFTGASSSLGGGLTYGSGALDALQITAQPASAVTVGLPSSLALSLVDASGLPVRNGEIVVNASAGSVLFSACGQPSCTLATDSNGAARTTVTATAPGPVILRASTAAGAVAQASFQANSVARAISFLRPTQYVAAGAAAVIHPAAYVSMAGSGAAGQSVTWTVSSPDLVVSSTATSSNQTGQATVAASAFLGVGEVAALQACAWASICGPGTVVGVAPASLRILPVGGDLQTVPAGGSLALVSFRITDTFGNPISGALANVYQAVTGWQPPCQAGGRCAAAPVFGTSSSTAISDDDGIVTVVPLQYANTASFNTITLTAGTLGTVTVVLQKTP